MGIAWIVGVFRRGVVVAAGTGGGEGLIVAVKGIVTAVCVDADPMMAVRVIAPAGVVVFIFPPWPSLLLVSVISDWPHAVSNHNPTNVASQANLNMTTFLSDTKPLIERISPFEKRNQICPNYTRTGEI